jgi:acetyltransferase-like isoleucine patch superfamily enzyme
MLHLIRFAARCRDKLFSIACARSFHGFGANSVIRMPARIGGERAIEVGNGVFIGANCWLEVMNPRDDAPEPVMRIEDRASIAGDCTITAVSTVVIGRGALIARFVHISDHSHEFLDTDKPVKDQGVSRIAPVWIGEGAWIGHGSVIMPGVRIGRNAVIGANSVVRCDIPDYSVAAGTPARIIRVLRTESPT